jgi:hypothetical protein
MIDFLKKYSLPIGLKMSVKRNKTKRFSSSYVNAKSILIYFTSEGNQKIAIVKGLQNKLEKEGKKVKCLYLLKREEDKPDIHMDEGMERLTYDDFSLFGEIQKPAGNKLLNEEFDYLIHADMESTIYSDLIMSKCKAKCRIGRYFHNHKDQYDMMVSIPDGKKINFLLDQIYHYTKAL